MNVSHSMAVSFIIVFLMAATLSCSSSRQTLPAVESTQAAEGRTEPAATPAETHALVRAGLWASPSGLVGATMRVVPGPELDSDAWSFYFGSSRAECRPDSSPAEWRFSSCELMGGLSEFKATVPRELNPTIETTQANDGGATRSLRFEYVPEIPEAPSERVDLVWHSPRNADCGGNTGVWAEGGLVFAPCERGIVEILDAADGRLLGVANANAGGGSGRSAVLEVTARDGLLYGATTRHGVLIWDLREPAIPRLVGQYIVERAESAGQSFTNVHTLTLSPRGNLLFAVNQSHPRSDFRVIDVSDPRRPSEVGRYLPQNAGGLAGGAHDMSLEERDGRLVAYFSQLGGAFHILDVTDPANIVELSRASWPGIFSHSSWPFASGGRRYVAHTDEGFNRGLSVLDVTDLRRPQVVSRYQSRPGTSIHNIRVHDGIAYISYYIDGLRVVDLRDPARPKEIAHYDTVASEDEFSLLDGAWGVHVDNGLVFISDRSSGVYAFRVRLP